MLLTPSGDVQNLDGTDPLLGTGLPLQRTDRDAVVEAGSSIVLHTDGLIETRHEDYELSHTRLRRALIGLSASKPGEIVDLVLSRLPRSPDDDTAILVAHLP